MSSGLPHCVAMAAALIALSSGCNQQRPQGLDTVPVSGSVSAKGNPVGRAVIDFYPSSEGAKAAQAFTDDDGNFDVSIYIDMNNTKRGLPPGEYQVAIRKLDSEAARATMRAPVNLLPKKYESAQTSGLKVTVSASAENVFPFALND